MAENHGPVIRPYTMVGGLFPMYDPALFRGEDAASEDDPQQSADGADHVFTPEEWARAVERHNTRPPCGTLPVGGVRIPLRELAEEAADA